MERAKNDKPNKVDKLANKQTVCMKCLALDLGHALTRYEFCLMIMYLSINIAKLAIARYNTSMWISSLAVISYNLNLFNDASCLHQMLSGIRFCTGSLPCMHRG